MAEDARGYVVIYKYPHFINKISFAAHPEAGMAVGVSPDVYLQRQICYVLEVRERDGFRDIFVISYVCLAAGLLSLIVLIRSLRRHRLRNKRYFRSSKKYENKLRL